MSRRSMIENDPARIREEIGALARAKGVELMGVADMAPFLAPGADILAGTHRFLEPYSRAVVLGIPWGVGTGRGLLSDTLEPLALSINSMLWDLGGLALVIHGDDELDPRERRGLLPLKALARQAGLGWQGRSLLIVNQDHGPLHRLIAILTDLDLEPDGPVRNRCGSCSACVEACPQGALNLVRFSERPETRQEILDVTRCIGNDTCPHCIEACPWLKSGLKASSPARSRRQA